MPETKFTPPGAEDFKAPKSEEPLFDDKDLDMDELFGEARAGEMMQTKKAEELTEPPEKNE